jgi:hypothetical protein
LSKIQFEGDLADLLIRSIGPTVVLVSAKCDYVDGSGIRTLKLLKAPAVLVLHDFTSRGFQAASIAPCVALPDVLGQCQTIVSDLEGLGAVEATLTSAGRSELLGLGVQIAEDETE